MVPGGGRSLAGRGYTIFDTGVGRCAIAWSEAGIVGVQLPLAREIETRKRLFQLYPEAASSARRPMSNPRSRALPRCCAASLPISPTSRSTSAASHSSMPRVYACARGIPRGETMHLWRDRRKAEAFQRRAFGGPGAGPQPIHDHRALPPRAGSRRLCRQDVREWRGNFQAPAAVDRRCARRDHEQDPVRRAAARCSGPPAGLNSRHEPRHAAAASIDFGVRVPLHGGDRRHAIHRALCQPLDLLRAQGLVRLPLPRPLFRAGGGIDPGRLSRRRIHLHARSCLRRRVPVVLPHARTGGGDRRPARGLADRRRAAAAGADGARRTGAGRGRWPQRYRPRRGRADLRQPLRRSGFRAAERAGAGSNRRDRRRAVETALWIDANSHRQIDLDDAAAQAASARSISCGCFPACSASHRTNI